MQPHIKLLKIITCNDIDKRKKLIIKHKDDNMLGMLLELMVSPEFHNGFNVTVPDVPRPSATVNTKDTINKFKSLIFSGNESKLKEYLSELDNATKFTYSHVAARTELRVPYDFIVNNFGLLTRIGKNEYPGLSYGFPELPCYAQVIPEGVQFVNVILDDSPIPTYLDGRYFKDLEVNILEELKDLNLKGTLTGYLIEDRLVVTNYYPEYPEDLILSERMMQLEKTIIKSSPSNIVSSNLFMLNNYEWIDKLLIPNHEIIFKQDTKPKFGNNKSIISLNCNDLINVKKVRDNE